jgi:hypothetical protein
MQQQTNMQMQNFYNLCMRQSGPVQPYIPPQAQEHSPSVAGVTPDTPQRAFAAAEGGETARGGVQATGPLRQCGYSLFFACI